MIAKTCFNQRAYVYTTVYSRWYFTMSKILSVRIEEDLYTKCIHHDLDKRTLVTKALQQYFRSKEPNKKLINGVYTPVNDNPVDSVYTQEYVDLLQTTIQDLRKDKAFLESQNNALLIMRTPLLQRIIFRLRPHDNEK
jgi:D-hexose-6-phosphate mutarotase